MLKMRLKKLMLLSLSCLCICSVSACGKKETEETSSADMSEEFVDDGYVDEGYDDYVDGEEVEETEPGQHLTVALKSNEVEEETKPSIPVDEFKKYGKIVKDKDGYRILGPDGYYISESLLNVNDNCFYFDENGFLKDDVFVPAKSSDGKVITKFVHNYSYLYGWVEINDKKYYIDEQEGRLENTSREIDGETYYFDNIGRSISKERYEAAYGDPVSEESVVDDIENALDGEGAVDSTENAEVEEAEEAEEAAEAEEAEGSESLVSEENIEADTTENSN